MKRFTLIFIICACVSGGCWAQTLSDFLGSARKGDTTAQFNAAQCYLYGWGTAPNATEWLHYLRLAAEGDEVRAQRELSRHLHATAPDIAAYWSSGRRERPNYHYRSYEDGCYYGELLGDGRDGYGTFLWDNGTYYKGCWESGERYGMGFTCFDNQTIYGNHSKGQMEGYGAIIITAEGCCIANAEGSVCYVGYFENGLPNGTGTLYDAHGTLTYYGPFEDGVPTHQYPSSEQYTSYRWGREQLPNGDSWEGEVFEGMRQGFGIYRWSDGSWWCGYWHEGLREGAGLFVRSDGLLMTGSWERGELQHGD